MSRIFINNVNNYLGLPLLEVFKGDPEDDNGNVFITTLDPKSTLPRPPGLKKCLNRSKPRLFRKYLLECDIIIYDLHYADLNEVEEKLKVIKAAKIEDSKVLVLISNVMVWGRTPTKQKVIQPEVPVPEHKEDEDRDQSIDKSQEEAKIEEQEQAVPEPIIVPIPYEESDYEARVPYDQYARWKAIEDFAISIAQAKENLKVYVMCAGLLYGNGEDVFKSHFEGAWLENPEKLPYVGKGNNRIPTIHVKDLAKSVKHIIDSKSEARYIFTFDNTKDTSQRSIIRAISEGIGTGLIESVPSKKAAAESWYEACSLDLWAVPSSAIVTKGDDEEIQTPFEWHCLKGIKENIRMLNEEFNAHRGLRPVRIFITGPPGAGKSFYSEEMHKHYNIPVIKLEDIIREEEEERLAKEKAKAKKGKKMKFKRKKDTEEVTEQSSEILEEGDRADQAEKKDKGDKKDKKDKKHDGDEEDKPAKKDKKGKKDKGDKKDKKHDSDEEDKPAKKDKKEKKDKKHDSDEEVKPAKKGKKDKKHDSDEEDKPAKKGKKEKKDKKDKKHDSDKEDKPAKKDKKEKKDKKHDSDEEDKPAKKEKKDKKDKKDRKEKKDKKDKKSKSLSQDEEEEIKRERLASYIELFRRKLSKNTCRNRGYVLDGWPSTYNEARSLFMKEIKPTQEEDEDSKLEPTYELDTQILPTNIIVLRGDIQTIIKKIKTLSEKQLKESKLDKKQLLVRYEEYTLLNLSRQSFAVQEFFSQNKIEVFEINCNLIYPEMIESIRTYIEREGRPFNFLESSEVLRQRRLQYINEQEEQKIQQLTSDSEALSIRNEQAQFDREKKALEIWQNLQHRQEELQSVRAMPLRKYLMENLLPVLAEGLLECCKVVPSDPVDYLSEYVFKHSHPPKTILD